MLDCARLFAVASVVMLSSVAASSVAASSVAASALPHTPKTLLGVPYPRGSTTELNRIQRIEYMAITVPSLEKAAFFYGTVMGGTEIEFCEAPTASRYCTPEGYVRISGDDHFQAMFGNDDAVNSPNISAAGKYEVISRFFVLGNALIQLVRYSRKGSGALFDLQEPMTSPCWMGKAHLNFWAAEGLDANKWIMDVENRSHALGLSDVKFNRPVPQETRDDRGSVPVAKFANKVVGGDFDGLAWAYFKGPIGEQLEMYQMERVMKQGVGRAYCNRGAVSEAFVAGRPDAACSNKTKAQRNYGLFQFGFRTHSVLRSTGFYTAVMGGDLITYPTQGIEIMRDDSAHWMILANETIESYEHAAATGISRTAALRKLGVANISSTGGQRLDHRFILFDNFVVEALEYTDGLSFGADGFDPTLAHSTSPAYLGTIVGAFGVHGAVDLSEFLSVVEERISLHGFRETKLPKALAGFGPDHPYAGLEYGYAKGPDSEAIVFTKISGSFQQKLKRALIASGGVSTMFDETNPFKAGLMNEFCAFATERQWGPYEI